VLVGCSCNFDRQAKHVVPEFPMPHIPKQQLMRSINQSLHDVLGSAGNGTKEEAAGPGGSMSERYTLP
jgi:hypothetical protein